MGAFFTHILTSSFGLAAIVCGSAEIMGVIPPPYGPIAMGVCAILNGIGHLFGADANKVVTKPTT